MIRQFLTRFMTGRYGMDQLNIALMVGYILLYLLFCITRLLVLDLLSLALVFITLFRMLSRNLERRRQENLRFLQLSRPLAQAAKTLHLRLKDREHRYFRCPNCGQQMRVPRGKGNITVHRRSCGATFQERS